MLTVSYTKEVEAMSHLVKMAIETAIIVYDFDSTCLPA
jgi:hypothetical protein